MNKVIFRKEFAAGSKTVNWFPGHMRKAMIDLEKELKKVDIFIEVRDARMPLTSFNYELI